MEEVKTKRCSRCKEHRPHDEFQKNRSTPDGLQRACRPCQNGYITDYRIENPDYAKTEGYRADQAICNERWASADPRRKKAHYAVRVAIKKGLLVKQPCERCGTTKHVQAHHEDYGKPLDVIWLCVSDHKVRHKELTAAGKSP